MMPLHRFSFLCALFAFALVARADDAIVVTPHPQAGKFKLQHDPDRPLLGFYGGIGLRKLPDGRWSGYGQSSERDVEYLIRRCRENGIKRIYGSFQEENYPSTIAPTSQPAGIDYVALCIKLAHENNIQVYADQPTFANVLARNTEFVKRNPHVLTRSITGEPDTHMLSPAYPEVRKFKRRLLMEFAQNYPIDGLQLDFIRYPYYDKDIRIGFGKHGYDQPTLDAFRKLYGYDASYIPKIDDPRWLRMKADLVTQFIRELKGDLKASGVDLPVGVYNSGVYGRGDSLRAVHQDWRTWEEKAIVDEHSPMFLMSQGMSNLARAVQSLSAVKRPAGRIIGPIFLAEGFTPGEAPTPDQVKDVARRLIKLGCDELWFCRASEIEELNLWPVVKEISQWSIRDIRAADFDPVRENLLKPEWTIDPPSAAVASTPLRVSLGNSPVRLAQGIRFRPSSYMPVDTLTFTASMRSTARIDPIISAHLTYLDGTTETLTHRAAALNDSPTSLRFVVKARTDFSRLVLTEARFTIELPTGAGEVEIRDADVQRDEQLARD